MTWTAHRGSVTNLTSGLNDQGLGRKDEYERKVIARSTIYVITVGVSAGGGGGSSFTHVW